MVKLRRIIDSDNLRGMQEAGARLKWAREKAGFARAREAAGSMGIVPSTYYNHEAGNRGFGEYAEKYARAFKVPLEWLLFGTGPAPNGAPRPENQDNVVEIRPRGSVMPEGVAVVREIDVRAGAGGGGVVASAYGFTKDGKNGDSVRERWGLPMSFVAGELRATSTNLDIIEVMGDSMEPTLSSGDRVVVDKSQTKPSPDGIFVLWDGYGVIVKRVEVIRGRTPAAIRVISDNKLHEPFELELVENHIIGRVVGRFSSRI